MTPFKPHKPAGLPEPPHNTTQPAQRHAIPNPHTDGMTPAQQFNQYLTRALGDLTIVHTNTASTTHSERLRTHLNRASWRLLRYSSESEAGTCPEQAPALIQAQAYRDCLERALDEAAALLTQTWNREPAEHDATRQATDRLIALYNTPIPTFPPALAQCQALLEWTTSP